MQEHKESKPSQPIGTGHAAAMFRLGLAELRAATYPESNVARHSEYGLYGTKTPGEVADDRREESVLESKMRQAGSRDDHGMDDRDHGLDR